MLKKDFNEGEGSDKNSSKRSILGDVDFPIRTASTAPEQFQPFTIILVPASDVMWL